MFLAVRISSYRCTWEVWRALTKLELLPAAAPRANFTLLSCSQNFPRASMTRYRHTNVPVNSKTAHAPPGQTPGHLTFLKNFGQIPRYVASLDGQMPHPLQF